MQVSVCLIVRNEQEHLPRALRSIPDDYEIVVADTGSTDGTVSIAQQFGAVIIDVPWSNDFAAARNASISAASGSYILIMDADEELQPDVREHIEEYLLRSPDMAGTALIRNILDDGVSTHRMVRIFPNRPEYRFAGKIHETVYHGSEPALSVDTNICLTHYGYSQAEYENKQKAERYLELYKEHLTDNPCDAYMIYQLGKLQYSIGKYAEARKTFECCMEFQEYGRLYFPRMLCMYGYTLKYLNESRLSKEMLTPFVQSYNDYPDLPFLLGLLAMDTGDVQHIEYYFQLALNIGETTKYASIEGVGTYKAAYNLGVFYEITGQREKAVHYYNLSSSYGYAPAIERRKIL